MLGNSYLKIAFAVVFFIGTLGGVYAQNPDTLKLPYKVTPATSNPYQKQEPSSNLNLKDPASVTTEVEYDPVTNQYTIHKKIGDVDYEPPYTMSFDEYTNYDIQKGLKEQWRKRYREETFEQQSGILPKLNIESAAFETIFGSSTIDIRPQGSAKLKFGVTHSRNENPSQSVDLQKTTSFDFDEEIQMNVTGKIGDNLEMKISYNTESSFDWENTMNLRYQGKEDDIIQKIEAGDVSLPLTTSLITGSQSLFGILTELRFGKLYVTSVFSQQKGETKTITVEGGAQKSEYELKAVEYDKNRHYFLSHYFREHYDESLNNLPLVNSSVTITKIEVWVTNTTQTTTNARNILAFMDLGEEATTHTIYGESETSIYNPTYASVNGYEYPDNNANALYKKVSSFSNIRNINLASKQIIAQGLKASREFEKVEYARELSSSEYTYDENLGYISLNSALNNDEVLAVAYSYTVAGESETFQVGEFASDGDSVLILKLIKGTSFNPRYPNWDLMMKNIYSLGAYSVNSENFTMEVEYNDDETGTNLYTLPNRSSLPALNSDVKDKKLLRLLNLDNLNSNNDQTEEGNGVFDFIDGVTIDATKGRIIFPVVEPFGGYLKELINNTTISKVYVFDQLYDSTQYKAKQVTSKNKFYITGNYSSEGGAEIYLNSFNIPEGSVKVTAGGITLTENVDYSVDYNMGRVKILNEAYLISGTPIKISLESDSQYGVQSKTLMGTHLDYRFNENFNLGATIMNLTERPLTEKVNVGDEPISNTIWGLNGSYRTDVPFITKVVDYIPLIQTKEMSTLSVEGEFAQLKPGHNKAITSSGEAFIDDFEGSESSIDLRSRTGWVLASIPQQYNYTGLFPEAEETNTFDVGANRGKLAWYQVDPLFFRSSSPVDDEEQENLKVYRVKVSDISDEDIASGESTEISTLDLAYFPDERGPYNYGTTRLNSEGKLDDPEESWGGIMRELTTSNFETQNIGYIEFWMMDPFVEDDSANTGGKLYFNLGNVSEDIVKDGRKSYEHGMPTDGTADYDETLLARVPSVQKSTTGFVNDGTLRVLQDIGLDGLSSTNTSDEQTFFADYLTNVRSIVTNTDALADILEDPSNDDYAYFQGDEYDSEDAGIIERYLKYNGMEGNTPYLENSSSSYNPTGQQYPDVEDINEDYTLSESESYFQYELDINKEILDNESSEYITDVRTITKSFTSGTKTVKWYQFRIPITDYTDQVNEIDDFTSIRFMRMFLTGWSSPIVLRFASLELVRSEWETYDYIIKEADEELNEDESYDATSIPFSLSTVNIEENGSRDPVNYVLPNGVDRQQDPSNPQLTDLNEQSMVLKVADLADGYSKAAYKTINMDMRDYGKLQMYVHAEASDVEASLSDGDVTCFVRIGSDFTDNYYEYEFPLNVTPWGNYDDDDEDDKYAVWPSENKMVIEFDDWVDLKLNRNAAIREGTASLLVPYSEYLVQEIDDNDVTRKITIKGNPTLANAQTIMIGVRNPLKKYNELATDDGTTKDAEIWVNELRLTDFNEDGGWAATGSMSLRLADFGTISAAGSTTQPGFGSIEQTAADRSKDETNQVDLSGNFELGKFFPKEANVRIPVYLGYSRTAVNPEYDPLNTDVTMEEALNDESLSDEEKELLRNYSQELTERKSLNFTNVGIGSKGKTKFYSPSNLSASYAYNETNYHDISTEYNNIKNYSGALNYVYNNQPQNVEPFKKSKLLKKPAFKLIKDFNFYYLPSQVSVQNTMSRYYNETLLRNLTNTTQTYTPTYDKDFEWNRAVNIKYNFSKGLKLDYALNTSAIIEEPEGRVDRQYRDEYEVYKEEVWNSIYELGTPKNHNQKFNVSYTVPINKIPLFDWVSSTAKYSSYYKWLKGSTITDSETSDSVINSISNSQNINLSGQLNLGNLYKKVKILDDIDKKYKKTKEQRTKPRYENVAFVKEGVNLTASTGKNIIHNLRTEEITDVAVMVNGQKVNSSFEVFSENKVVVTVDRDFEGANIKVTGKREIKDNPFIIGLEQMARVMMGVKNVSGTYSLTNGTSVSGYRGTYQFSALHEEPGLPFVFGMQDTNIIRTLVEKELLITDEDYITPFKMSSIEVVNLKTSIEPFKSLKIDLTGKWSHTDVWSEYIYPDAENIGEYTTSNSAFSGAYSVDIWMLNSAFDPKPDEDNPVSAKFEAYKQKVMDLAWEDAARRVGYAPDSYNSGEYDPGVRTDSTLPTGYSSSDPSIAIPAFLSTYGNYGVNSTTKQIFNWRKLRPSWSIKFDGIGDLEVAKKYFKNFTLSHGYNSTFTISSYTTNVLYSNSQAESSRYGNHSWVTTKTDTALFVTQYDISSFAATEQFVPLLGVDITWKNNVLSKVEYKKTRTITMSLVNDIMTEIYTWDWVFGTGYRFDDLKLNLNNKPIVSDLNLRADLSVRDGITITHDLLQSSDEVIAGQKIYTLKITADYQLSDKLTVQLYFDYKLTDPKVTSSSYRNSTTDFGFTLQFSLAQ